MYKIYPTLLDSFMWYKNSVDYKEAALAKQELLDRINRVPQVETPMMTKGKAFKKLVDAMAENFEHPDIPMPFDVWNDYEFDDGVLKYFATRLQWSIKEYFTSAQIVVDNEVVELYGYVDNIKEDVIIDVKFVQNYEVNKYFSSCQRLAYPYCLECNGAKVSQFEFLASNGEQIFSEVYNWKPERDVPMLKKNLRDFIDFVNKNRTFITDKKLFGND